MTQGYRKIPGNRCIGGVDLNPATYSCSGLGGWFSIKSLLTYLVIGLALYYGWPIIEGIVIILPIPDPKEILQKVKSILLGTFQSAQSSLKPPQKKGPGYASNFNQAPETLGDSDDEDDIGRTPQLGPKKKAPKNNSGLSYGDSDEDEEKEGTQLITLDGASSTNRDRTHSAAENVPKLQRPE